MTLEADEAVQEARFAGACQDQHAGRPAPGLAKRQQSCNKPKQVSFPYQGYGLGPGFLGAWGPGLAAGASRGALGAGPSRSGATHFRRSEKDSWWEAGEGVGDG